MKLQLIKLKAEVHFLKIKSGKFEKKAAKSEMDNKTLRKEIEALKGNDDAAPSLPPAGASAHEPEPTAEATV